MLGVGRWFARSSAAAACVAILALVSLEAGLAAPARATPGTAKTRPVVVAVWAHVDANTPVAGATVRVYATARPPASWSGQPAERLLIGQSSGRRAERTYRTGVALLAFTRLPRAFTVEVIGGRAGGRRLPGALAAVVRGYSSGTVVYVNPVTTLIAGEVATSPDRSRASTLAVAQRRVYRLLGIPGWEDDSDLSYSDRYFDGASYLAAARSAGGIATLDQALVREARRGGQAHRFLQSGQIRQPAFAASGPRASVAVVGAGAVISAAFKSLASWAGSSLAGVVGEKAGNAALGWLLAAFGLDDKQPGPGVLEIKRLVEELGKQVTQLQGEVTLAGFSTLLHQTNRTTGQIKHAFNDVADLANMPAKDPTKRAFTQTIIDYIGTNLIDAPEILNQHLGSTVGLADNLLKSASRTLVGKRRFFGPRDSAQVRSIYEYFASYQVQLAMLLQEYFHAKPMVYSPRNAEANLDRLRGNVESQAGSLKPDVPADTVIDTKSREMWVTDLPDPKKRLFDIAQVLPRPGSKPRFSWRTRENVNQCGTRRVDGPTGVRGFAYCNWELPTAEAYRRLTEGWEGKSPASWLVSVAGFNAGFIQASGHVKWVRRDYPTGLGSPYAVLRVYQFDLSNNSLFSHDLMWRSPNWQREFERVYAALMYVRKLAPDESYWWSG